MLSGIAEFVIFGFLPLMIGICVGPAPSGTTEQTISGQLVIPPARWLPDNAVATVELVEQRSGESLLPAVARETVRWRGAETQKFAIRFDRSAVRPAAFYAVRARIVTGRTVLFETQGRQPVLPSSAQALTLLLTPAIQA